MIDYELFSKVLTGVKEFNNIKEYLKETKKVPNLDVETDNGEIEIANFTNQVLNKIVVFESFYLDNKMFAEYELESPYCVLAKKTLLPGQEISAQLNNSKIREQVIPDSLIKNKINEIINKIKDKSYDEQSRKLNYYGVPIAHIEDLNRQNPYSEKELNERLNVNSIRQSLLNHLKKDNIVVLFSDEEKSYIEGYKIIIGDRCEKTNKCILKYDYDFLNYRKQYLNVLIKN